MQPLELKFAEHVTVDSDRLVELCIRMGESRAEEMIAVSIKDLWDGLERLRETFGQQNFDQIATKGREMAETADHLGLYMFARVCRDVAFCASRRDGPSLSACLCRLHRLADDTINSVWDLCDISS